MITTAQLMTNIDKYVEYQLVSMAKTNPVIGFTKPLISRMINKKLKEFKPTIELLADKEGFIDAEGIIQEMFDSMTENSNFNMEVPFLGNIFIGKESIRISIPYTENMLVLDKEDLGILKEMLTSKN